MNDISKIGPVLRELRVRTALSQRALAARAQTTQAAVARIESGASVPSIGTLQRLVAAAGFDLKIQVVERLPADPVIEFYKRDVDRTLLMENLKKTPSQRVQALVAMARLSAEMHAARRRTRVDR